MGIIPVTLNNKSAPSRFRQGGDAHLINCYVEQIGDEGKVPWAIYSSDGLQGWCALPNSNGGVRATLFTDGALYVVAGTRFYSVNITTQVGTLIASMNIDATSPVYIERNRRVPSDIMIVCNGLGYYYREGTFGLITNVDADLFSPQSLTFNNGYFVVSTADNRYQAGTIDDVLSWDPLSYGRADVDPDAIKRVATYQGDLVIFGESTTQFARDVGTTPFPFQDIQSIDIGMYAPNSVATVEQTLAFIASDRSVRMLSGYEAKKISSHAVDRDIEDIEDESEIVGTSWVSSGHTFYSLSSKSWTWVFDTVTNLWHERKTYGQNGWKISNVVSIGNKLIAGDRTSAVLYDMSPDYKDEAGNPLVSQIVLPPVHAFPNPLTFNSLYVDVQVGVGTGQGVIADVDPSVMLEWSDNGGDNYKSVRHLQLGKQGGTTTRVRTHRLGQSKEDGYTFRVSWSAKVARALYGMAVDIEKDVA